MELTESAQEILRIEKRDNIFSKVIEEPNYSALKIELFLRNNGTDSIMREYVEYVYDYYSQYPAKMSILLGCYCRALVSMHNDTERSNLNYLINDPYYSDQVDILLALGYRGDSRSFELLISYDRNMLPTLADYVSKSHRMRILYLIDVCEEMGITRMELLDECLASPQTCSLSCIYMLSLFIDIPEEDEKYQILIDLQKGMYLRGIEFLDFLFEINGSDAVELIKEKGGIGMLIDVIYEDNSNDHICNYIVGNAWDMYDILRRSNNGDEIRIIIMEKVEKDLINVAITSDPFVDSMHYINLAIETSQSLFNRIAPYVWDSELEWLNVLRNTTSNAQRRAIRRYLSLDVLNMMRSKDEEGNYRELINREISRSMSEHS